MIDSRDSAESGNPAASGSKAQGAPADAPYLFEDLAIAPPLEEFRRLYLKKIRSFESEGKTEVPGPYRHAFELGERKILQQLGQEGGAGEERKEC